MEKKHRKTLFPILKKIAEENSGAIRKFSVDEYIANEEFRAQCNLACRYKLLETSEGGPYAYQITLKGRQQLEEWNHPTKTWLRKNG